MSSNTRTVSSLSVSDLECYPVWQFAGEDESDDAAIRPVRRVPVPGLAGKLVAIQLELANGSRLWGLLGNLDSKNARMNEHFATLSIEKKGRWFQLARYHDFDFSSRGPTALSKFLGLKVSDIFPITYDARKYVKGSPAPLAGKVLEEPLVRLSRAEIIAMAAP